MATTPGYRKVTPEDIIKAAEENGYKWYRGGWFAGGSGSGYSPITEACVLGQAALNLEVDHEALFNFLRSLHIDTTVGGRRIQNVGNITLVNDDEFMYGVKTYKGMVKVLKRLLKNYMGHEGIMMRKKHLTSQKITD